MPIRRRIQCGISMMEMMIVLAIIAILAVASVTMVGNRPAAAVRSVLDEVEGSLSAAHGAAVASGRDVALVTWGSWDNPPLVIAHADAGITDDNQVKSIAALLLSPPNNLQTAITAINPTYGLTVAVPFHPVLTDVTHSRARIVMRKSTDWTTAMSATPSGATNEDITSIIPFKAGAAMASILGTDTNFIFNDATNRVVISGANKRFTGNVVIQVVAVTSNGLVIPGGPMGLLVVQTNGASIYKFYNPGILNGDGKWRRI